MKKQLPQIGEQLTENGLYKIVAFFVAAVIWTSTLWGKKDAILIRDMDIEFLVRSNHFISEPVDRRISVRVTGPRSALKKFSQVSNVVSVNLTNDTVGPHEVEISSRTLDLPPGVRLLSVQPNRLKVDIKEGNTDQ